VGRLSSTIAGCAALVAGCGSTPTRAPAAAAPSAPFADCAALAAPPERPDGSAAGAGAAAELPDLTLPCFAGGPAFRLADLRGPAVLNLWGSWCGPCRDELPAVQRVADRAAGRLHVIGVDTRDSRTAASAFAADEKITMPTLYDDAERLRLGLGVASLPATVFVDAAGKRRVYTGPALDEPRLAQLIREHTGVAVEVSR
jgi:thiol-disulfide isomerase/thioredoxin